MRVRRAFLLPLALMLATLFGVIGGAFMQAQATLYGGGSKLTRTMQARQLAEIGIEDARCKLLRDLDFPPPGTRDQRAFSYIESYQDPFTATNLGTYTVTVDTTYREAPYFLVVVRSVGFVQSGGETAMKTLVAELDVSPQDRNNPGDDNPHYLQLLRWREL